MKTSNIERKANIFTVTKSPNLLQKLFGVKEKIEKYKLTGEVYHYAEHIKVIYKETGELMNTQKLLWMKVFVGIVKKLNHKSILKS